VTLCFHVVTLFPEMITGYLGQSILGRAREAGLIGVDTVDPRSFATDKHRTVDDAPFGGGAGMVMMAEPLYQAVEHLRQVGNPGRVVLLGPAGRPFNQRIAQEYAQESDLTLLCGRYEGVDERVAAHVADEELSIGDFVLTGGELGALTVIDAVARLIPGVLGHAEGACVESWSDLPLLEHPQYTRPRVWREHPVPEVLLGGDHAKIAAWRHAERIRRTRERRPDWLGPSQDPPPPDPGP
jgi:tRNA (guanine37-N1)-methyltransferase